MKLASFVSEGQSGWGVVDDVAQTVSDVSGTLRGRFGDLKSAIAADALATVKAAAADAPAIPFAALSWQPVIPNPAKILCVGHNYESHRQETGRAKVAHPSIFTRFADTLIGHGTPILRPRQSESLDFEGELAVIIGTGGRHIAQSEAYAHVAGYAPFNDASVRDWQWHTQQFTPGKNFPGTGAFGPWMITADEMPDAATTSVTTRLNGTVVQSQPTADMLFSVPVIIAYLSAFTELSPGDVICSGTPGGVGAKRTPPLWMKPGDRVEVEIPGVGLLVNMIEDEVGT